MFTKMWMPVVTVVRNLWSRIFLDPCPDCGSRVRKVEIERGYFGRPDEKVIYCGACDSLLKIVREPLKVHRRHIAKPR